MLPAAKYIKINEIRPFTSRNSPSGWESSWNAKDQILICFLDLKHFLCWVYHIKFLCFICLVFLSLKVKDLQLRSVIFFIVPFFSCYVLDSGPSFVHISQLHLSTDNMHIPNKHTSRSSIKPVCCNSVFHWFPTFMLAMHAHQTFQRGSSGYSKF